MNRRADRTDADTCIDAWLVQDADPAQRVRVLRELEAQAYFAGRLIEQGVAPRRQAHLSRFQAACSAASQVLRQIWKEHHRSH